MTHRIVALETVSKGKRVHIIEIPEGKGGMQLVRLGILSGEFVRCVERLPGGTVVIEKNRREIALGAPLARKIMVRVVDADHVPSR